MAQSLSDESRLLLFDSHFHIIDPRFPLIPNLGYLPGWFTIEDYHKRTAPFQVIGGAVVSGSFQGFDQTYLLEALRRLGPRFVGVTQLPDTTLDERLLELDAAGVRALRFNIYRGGSASIDRLEEMARRVFAVSGWHVELYVDAKDLADLAPRLLALPRVSIDHLGLARAGFTELLRLVERGVYVKATGFGRGDLDVAQAMRAICEINPAALLFGTDLPSTRVERPFHDSDASLVPETLGEQVGRRVLIENALSFYRLDHFRAALHR